MTSSQRERLLTLLAKLDDLLGRHHVRYDVIVHELRQRVEKEAGPEVSDSLRTEVLAMFEGTMGSLGDVYITCANEHHVDDEQQANRKLSALRSELYRELTGA